MLQVKNLTKSYGENTVLDAVDFSIDQGEVVAVLGPSGSGKSTFLATLNGLVTPEKGQMHFENRWVDLASPSGEDLFSIRRNMGMVFQSFGLFPHLTVSQQITLPLEKVHGFDSQRAKKRADHLLSTLGLLEKTEAYPSQLSGGQKQRVGIARALGPNPDLMLFDEPTSALDPELVGGVIDAISDLAKQGMTMIVVTHEVQMAREIADRIVFFDGGKVLFDDAAERAFEPMAPERMQRFFQRFIGSGI